MPAFKGDLTAQDVPRDLIQTARTIVARVRKTSELAELWAEEDDTEWQEVLDDLLARLTPSKPYRAPAKQVQPEVPDDFLGYCYICYGTVTERNGLRFEHTPEHGVTCATYPHRKCIEDQIPGPHWMPDGSPMPGTLIKLLRDMGVKV
jgi:hypothetical protein